MGSADYWSFIGTIFFEVQQHRGHHREIIHAKKYFNVFCCKVVAKDQRNFPRFSTGKFVVLLVQEKCQHILV